MESGKNLSVWESSGHRILYIPYTYKHVFKFEVDNWNPYKVHKFILNYWHFSFLIVGIYVLIIHAIQTLMKPLKAFKLSTPLIMWNVVLALFSLAGTIRVGEEFLYVLLTRKRSLHDSICIGYDPAGIASLWNFLFISSKVAELIDSVFIVLRKKKLIFLHWYHHAAVLVVSWNGARMIIAPSRVYIFMNFFVHSLMYTYYAITATGKRLSRRCAMFITTIQNLQMLLGVAITSYVAKVKWIDQEFCHVSNENLALCFFVYLTFGILFCKFFVGAYLRSANKSDEVAQSKEKKLK